METAGLVFTVIGAIGSTAAALWLLLGFKPESPRYTDDGLLYPGPQTSRVVPNLLRDQ